MTWFFLSSRRRHTRWPRDWSSDVCSSDLLAQAGAAAARGATLYVTLEPCNHTGRTPPCMEAIRTAGVKRVVIAMRDPNPRVPGGGADALAGSGVEVALGCREAEAMALNRVFITAAR